METKIERMNCRLQEMKNERSSFDGHWKEVAQFTQPRLGRFITTDVNKGDKRYRSIINSAATQAVRVARAGLHAGVMSPARPWFSLETSNPDLMESQAVKVWLSQVTLLLQTIFAKSNLYTMAPTLLGELLTFGTGAMFHLDDYDTVARFYTMTIGQYWLAQNEKLQIDTILREYQMTTRQMIQKFGLANVSRGVKDAYDHGKYENRWDVCHIIHPNTDYEDGHPMAKKFAFASCYWEPKSDEKDKVLEEGGFQEFPVICPRWEVTGEDVYATDCPGMTALGDVKGLQVAEKRLAQGVDKQVNPPLKGPASLKGQQISSLPGGVTLYDGDPQRERLEPLYNVAPQVGELTRNIDRIERRIKQAFFEDLFRSIASMEGVQPQNELFLTQQRQETLLQLGPMLERLHNEGITKIIDRTFNQCMRAKPSLLPPAPPELQGQPLQVSYVSPLMTAQRAVATSNIDRVTAYIGGLAAAGFPQAADKFDADQAVDEYANALGVPPKLIVPDEQVAQIRQQRQQAQQAAQTMGMVQAGAGAAKDLASADTSGPNALTALTQGVQNGGR